MCFVWEVPSQVSMMVRRIISLSGSIDHESTSSRQTPQRFHSCLLLYYFSAPGSHIMTVAIKPVDFDTLGRCIGPPPPPLLHALQSSASALTLRPSRYDSIYCGNLSALLFRLLTFPGNRYAYVCCFYNLNT